LVPAVDHGFGFLARGSIGPEPARRSPYVGSTRPNTHVDSIGAALAGVDPAQAFLRAA
jgi:hypothetical protein